jgi:hypothetical protein
MMEHSWSSNGRLGSSCLSRWKCSKCGMEVDSYGEPDRLHRQTGLDRPGMSLEMSVETAQNYDCGEWTTLQVMES